MQIFRLILEHEQGGWVRVRRGRGELRVQRYFWGIGGFLYLLILGNFEGKIRLV